MQIMTSGADGPTVVTIGNFDGVHLGHQALIQRARDVARDSGREMAVLTFDPHPAAVLRGSIERFLISPGSLKLHYLAAAGSELVRVLPFSREFAQMEGEQFLDVVLRGEMRSAYIVVGYNFTYGRGGLGTVELLTRWGSGHGIEVEIAPPFYRPGTNDAVSSSWIRSLVQQGDLKAAHELLGHAFSVEGRVMHGDQRGRQLAAPTLNLVPPAEQVMPPYGVYAGMVAVAEGSPAMAVANWGVRPTFGGREAILEVHALEPLSGEHYGQSARFDMLHYLREERAFPSSDALGAQIREDVQQARSLLETSR